jgi:hypothetical protein
MKKCSQLKANFRLYLVRPVKLSLSIVSLLTAISAAAAQTTSSSPAPVGGHKAKALAIHAPPPAYPVDERGHRPTGSAIVVMEIDRKTGWHIRVHAAEGRLFRTVIEDVLTSIGVGSSIFIERTLFAQAAGTLAREPARLREEVL